MTTIELLVPALLRAQLAASVGVALVLALRVPTRRLFGAELAYRLWLLPAVCAFASLFPTLREFLNDGYGPAAGVRGFLMDGLVDWTSVARSSGWIAGLWAVGVAVALLAMALGEWRFQRLARVGRAGPAVSGVAWPRMVVPADYHARFTAKERAFILAHERVHIARRDPTANLWIAACLAVGWFNPLAHLGAELARLDQELACDAVVIDGRPAERRAYAEALVKAQIVSSPSPLACFWGKHPLELRVRQLTSPRVSLTRHNAGAMAVGGVCVALALVLWGLAPL